MHKTDFQDQQSQIKLFGVELNLQIQSKMCDKLWWTGCKTDDFLHGLLCWSSAVRRKNEFTDVKNAEKRKVFLRCFLFFSVYCLLSKGHIRMLRLSCGVKVQV